LPIPVRDARSRRIGFVRIGSVLVDLLVIGEAIAIGIGILPPQGRKYQEASKSSRSHFQFHDNTPGFKRVR
jgi:hypothetical protein